jgi:hypothetical protein
LSSEDTESKKHVFNQNILYVPLETTTIENYNLLKKVIEQGKGIDLDFIFVDNRPTPTVAEQYFYKIDLDQPILIRNNSRTRKLIAFLNNIDELETFFQEGYQFLTSLRMIPLSRTTLQTMYNLHSVNQTGGQDDEEGDELFEEDDLMEQIVHPTDILYSTESNESQPNILNSILPKIEGVQKRNSRKQSRRKALL